VDREGGVVDGRQASRETGPPGVVAVLVPPPILQEVETVFQPPVVANVPQEVRSGNAVRIKARDKIPHVARENLAAGSANLAINAQCYATAAPGESFADVVGVLEVNP
jgi:hypothetical protein